MIMMTRDYWSDQYVDSRSSTCEKRLKGRCDQLARIASDALQALEDMGKEDFLLLKHDHIRSWWKAQKEDDARVRKEQEAKEARKLAREAAMSKLTDEEKILLGLKKR